MISDLSRSPTFPSIDEWPAVGRSHHGCHQQITASVIGFCFARSIAVTYKRGYSRERGHFSPNLYHYPEFTNITISSIYFFSMYSNMLSLLAALTSVVFALPAENARAVTDAKAELAARGCNYVGSSQASRHTNTRG